MNIPPLAAMPGPPRRDHEAPTVDNHNTLTVVTATEKKIFQEAYANLLDNAALRWLYKHYRESYQTRIASDLDRFSHIEIEPTVRAKIHDRVINSLRVVAATSSWYKIAQVILRGGFRGALLAGTAAGLIAVVQYRDGASPLEIAAAVLVSTGWLFAFIVVGLRLSRGLRFDVVWFAVWGAFFWFANKRWNPQLHNTRLGALLSAPLLQSIHGVANLFISITSWSALAYAVIMLASTIVGGLVFIWTTIQKKRRAEEEIIETSMWLLDLLGPPSDYIERADRITLTQQLDWIADRFECDFFRPFNTEDPFASSWSDLTAKQMACAARRLRQNALLPNRDRIADLKSKVSALFLNAANGYWNEIERADISGQVTERRRSKILTVVSTALSIVIPVSFAIWAAESSLSESIKASLTTGAGGLAIANLLAALNPGGFDKQITAAKTLSEILQQKP